MQNFEEFFKFYHMVVHLSFFSRRLSPSIWDWVVRRPGVRPSHSQLIHRRRDVSGGSHDCARHTRRMLLPSVRNLQTHPLPTLEIQQAKWVRIQTALCCSVYICKWYLIKLVNYSHLMVQLLTIASIYSYRLRLVKMLGYHFNILMI